MSMQSSKREVPGVLAAALKNRFLAREETHRILKHVSTPPL